MKKRITALLLSCALLSGCSLFSGGTDAGASGAKALNGSSCSASENSDDKAPAVSADISAPSSTSQDSQYNEALEAGAKGKPRLSAWAAYWDTETVLTELKTVADKLDALYYFEAFFDGSDKLYVPKEVNELKYAVNTRYTDRRFKSYITFVNDVRYDDGSFSLKDTDLLYRLFADTATMQKHIDDIVKYALKNGYNGIDIDYENIRKEKNLWGYFEDFCNRLYKKTEENGLALRITLESETPFSELKLPSGATYAVMCYNLYGNHSGAGPKADADFLRDIVARASALPGKVEFAVATGGYDWGSDETCVSLSEADAGELANKYNVKPKYDKKSGCAVFEYTDSGVSHEVWYADASTLNFWTSIICEKQSYNIALWRFGGNNTLKYFMVE